MRCPTQAGTAGWEGAAPFPNGYNGTVLASPTSTYPATNPPQNDFNAVMEQECKLYSGNNNSTSPNWHARAEISGGCGSQSNCFPLTSAVDTYQETTPNDAYDLACPNPVAHIATFKCKAYNGTSTPVYANLQITGTATRTLCTAPLTADGHGHCVNLSCVAGVVVGQGTYLFGVNPVASPTSACEPAPSVCRVDWTATGAMQANIENGVTRYYQAGTYTRTAAMCDVQAGTAMPTSTTIPAESCPTGFTISIDPTTGTHSCATSAGSGPVSCTAPQILVQDTANARSCIDPATTGSGPTSCATGQHLVSGSGGARTCVDNAPGLVNGGGSGGGWPSSCPEWLSSICSWFAEDNADARAAGASHSSSIQTSGDNYIPESAAVIGNGGEGAPWIDGSHPTITNFGWSSCIAAEDVTIMGHTLHNPANYACEKVVAYVRPVAAVLSWILYIAFAFMPGRGES